MFCPNLKSLKILAFSLLLTAYCLLLSPVTAYAAEAKCQSDKECADLQPYCENNEVKQCTGGYCKPDDPNADSNGCVRSCNKVTNTSQSCVNGVLTNASGGGGGAANTGSTCDPTDPKNQATGCAISAKNFGPPELTGFAWNNFLGNAFACSLGPFPIVGSCDAPVVEKDGEKIKTTNKLFSYIPNGGAIGTTTMAIGMIYSHPPASGARYLAEVFQTKFGLINPAYAQVTGSGAAVIQPVQKLWQVCRNLAYLFFIVVMIIIGFMIMFKAKATAQASVALQQAIPGVIIALILVTFSYFIAGLVIDLAFWGSQFIGVFLYTTLGAFGAGDAAQHTQKLLNNYNLITMFWSLFGIGSGAFSGLNGQLTQTTGQLVGGVGTHLITALLGGLAACLNPVSLAAITATGAITVGAGIPVAVLACAGGGAAIGGTIGPTIVSAIVYLILLIGLLQAMFRLLYSLIGSYVAIVLSTVTAPFTLMMAAIPGQGNKFEGWIRGLLGNVLVFPAVFGGFLVAAYILGIGEPWDVSHGQFVQFTQTLPLLGGSGPSIMNLILAYGIMLALPSLPGMVKEALKAKDNNALMQAAAGIINGGVAGTTMLGHNLSEIPRQGLRLNQRNISQSQLMQDPTWKRFWRQVNTRWLNPPRRP